MTTIRSVCAAAKTVQTGTANGGNGGAGIKGRRLLVHIRMLLLHIVHTDPCAQCMHRRDMTCMRFLPCVHTPCTSSLLVRLNILSIDMVLVNDVNWYAIHHLHQYMCERATDYVLVLFVVQNDWDNIFVAFGECAKPFPSAPASS